MTINVKGADGSSFAFPDGTAEADITGAMDAHYGSAAAPSVANADPRFSGGGMAGEKFLEGVPVLGGAIPSIGAAISAAAQPLTGVGAPGATFAERHAANLEAEKAASKAADIAQPGLSTALKVGGGIASFGGALKAVPALAGPLGLEGTIPQMVTKGAMSGAGISAADALARGEDPGSAAVEGGVLGAAGGPVGRLMARLWAPVCARYAVPLRSIMRSPRRLLASMCRFLRPIRLLPLKSRLRAAVVLAFQPSR